MNRQIPLIYRVRSPEGRIRDVRQGIVGRQRNKRQAIHSLCTVGVAEKVFARVVEHRALFQILRPRCHRHAHARGFVVFDRVLVDGSVDQTKIIDDPARLGTFPGPEEPGDRNGRQQGDDRNYDHDFHEGEAPALFIELI